MKTLSVVSQKGGAGKTTLALHLAVACSCDGRNTAVIDLDPQASAAKWSDRREVELPIVLSAHASRLQQEIKRVMDSGGDILILDTAPHLDSAILEAAKVSDLIMIPCRPAILDLEAVTNTLSLVQTTGKPVTVVMNAVGASGREADEAADAIASLGIDVCPIRLVNRVAFARALISGQAAQEFQPDGKAAKEIEQLHLFVCSRMSKCTNGEEYGK